MRRVLAALAVLLALLVGYVTLDVYDVVPGYLTLGPPPDPTPDGGEPTSGTAASPTVAQPRTGSAAMPLPASGAQAPLPTPAGIRAAVGPVLADPALAGPKSVAVRDAVTGAHLLDVDPATPLTPASSVKLLAAAAVESTFPAGATLTTRVVQGSAGQVHLVAGGDTLLAPGTGDAGAVVGHAGLGDLATATATALRTAGAGRVAVHLDLSYAPGPLTAPTWPSTYRASGITGAVAAIGLSTQRATPGHPGPADPPVAVLAAFVTALRAQGIDAAAAGEATAPAGAAVLASVRSAPVADVLGLALDESDNALTESLARQATYRRAPSPGRPIGFEAAAAYVRTAVAALGVDLTGVSTVDTSGLSRENKVPARVLGDLLTLGASGKVPGLTATWDDLAVAGLSGTLQERFQDPDTHRAAGVTQAKTGTLTGVNALAGTVVTAQGRLLTFAVISNGSGTLTARAALDRFVAALADCGCRS